MKNDNITMMKKLIKESVKEALMDSDIISMMMEKAIRTSVTVLMESMQGQLPSYDEPAAKMGDTKKKIYTEMKKRTPVNNHFPDLEIGFEDDAPKQRQRTPDTDHDFTKAEIMAFSKSLKILEKMEQK